MALGICSAAILVYQPTFTGKFILDDHPLIENNEYIKGYKSISGYIFHEDGVSQQEDLGDYHTGYYRPLITLTYWIDYKIWGLWAPGFRITNLILHLVCCWVLLAFLEFQTKDPWAAWCATLLFALHPVSTEAVSWITSRNNILVTLFGLLSLYLFARDRQTRNRTAFILSVICFALAVFSKEFGLMILPILFLYQRLLSGNKLGVAAEIKTYLPYIAVSLVYFIFRLTATGSLLTPSSLGNVWERVYFSFYLVFFNLKLILLPYGLHSFIMDYPEAYWSVQGVAGVVLCVILGLLLWKQRNRPQVTFSLLSFLVALWPVLNIIPFRSVTLISMRWLYLPMTMLWVGVAVLLGRWMKAHAASTRVIVALIAAYLGGYTYVLNKNLWHDEPGFFELEVVRFNNKFYAGGLAESLLDRKAYKEAEKYFQVAIDRYPREALNYLNYSALLLDVGRPTEAVSRLEEARDLHMTSQEKGQWFNNMGMACMELDQHEKAVRRFEDAVRVWPDEAKFWGNLGAAYGRMGEHERAVQALEKGLELDPDSRQLRRNLTIAYRKLDKQKDADTGKRRVLEENGER